MCSKIGFGGSRLHYLLSRKHRRALIESAFGWGINYFDVAPLYGFGLAERALGEFLNSHRSERSQIVVATKWGYAADPIMNSVPADVVTCGYFFALLKNRLARADHRDRFNRRSLFKSVEDSLCRLQTEYIDILWMHEPEVGLVSDWEEINAAFDVLQSQGKVKYFGVAGYAARSRQVIDELARSPKLYQCEESGWDNTCVPDVTFNAISPGVQRFNADTIESDSVALRLKRALKRRNQGVVLVSTTKLHNLSELSKIASDCD